MTYKDILIQEMNRLATIPNVRFIGYNTRCGHRFNGTLNDVPEGQCIEMPVAENLIMGVAMGLSLQGFLPVVCIERMDFLLACADAIINHLDALPKLSGGQFDFPLIIRTCVGSTTPLDAGRQHTSDYSMLFQEYILLHRLTDKHSIELAYNQAELNQIPIMTVEYKSAYNQEV